MKKENLPWTEQEYQFLRENYFEKGPTWCSRNIGTKRSIFAVRFQAYEIGLRKKVAWSEDQLDILKQNYGKMSNKKLSLLLNKNVSSILQMAFKLKINCINYHDWTEKEIELLKLLYTNSKKDKILYNFPNLDWLNIKKKANELGLKKQSTHMDSISANVNILLSDDNLTAYWIGFLLADGHFSKTNRLQLSLATKDKEHVIKFGKYLNFNGNYKSSNVNFGIAVMDTFNLPIIKQKYDIHHQKTYNPPNINIFKNLSDNLFISLLIGFIDGDGTIASRKGLQSKLIGIKCHSSWLEILNYFIIRLGEIVKIPLTSGYIDKRGYAQIYITNNVHVKFLKEKAIGYNLPILNRKWDKINLNFVSREENAGTRREKVKEMLCNGLTPNYIAENLGENIQNIYADIRILNGR